MFFLAYIHPSHFKRTFSDINQDIIVHLCQLMSEAVSFKKDWVTEGEKKTLSIDLELISTQEMSPLDSSVNEMFRS